MFKPHHILVPTDYSSFTSPNSCIPLTPFKMDDLLFPEHPSQFFIYVLLSFDHLDNPGFYLRSFPTSPSQWKLPHIPGKGSLPLICQLDFAHVSIDFVIHCHFLFAFLFFLLLNFSPWHPHKHLAPDGRAMMLVIFEFPKPNTVLGI